MTSDDDVTRLLIEWSAGSEEARDRLLPLVYQELRRIARRQMNRERGTHTLQATALVNEAYLRLIDQSRADWKNRAQFYGVAAGMMRRILIDYARSRGSTKRSAEANKAPLDDAAWLTEERAAELVALDDALSALEKVNPRGCKVVELRYFGGMNNKEAAEVLRISETTVERDWRLARAWLYRELRAR